MIFSPINEKIYKRDKSYYIDDKIDISEKSYSLPMPPNDFILNQYYSSTCVAHAVTMAVMVAIKKQANKWVKLSPYSMHGYLDSDGGGTHPWYMAETLCRFGMLPARDFLATGDNPQLHDALVSYAKKNPGTEKKAAYYKGIAYAEIDNFDDVKRALKAGYPVVGSIRCGRSFGKVNGGIEPMYPKNADSYHAIEFNGWCEKDGKEYLIAINSHGIKSGDDGNVYIPRGRLIQRLTLIDFDASHMKYKPQKTVFCIGAMRAKIDFNLKEFEVAPYIKGNRTFVPVRFIAENLGATVTWNAFENKATIESEEAVIELHTNSNIITVDGKPKKMDVAPEIINDRMMIPIRYIAEALNCNVEWIAEEQKAVITAL